MSEQYEYLVADDAGEPATVLARARLARRQAELLAALSAGAPLPPGFDPEQVRVQARGLAAKRRDTVAKVAPELPALLGGGYGPAFLRYAAQAPMTGGYRAEALAFAAWALAHDETLTGRQLRELGRWYTQRAGSAPRSTVGARLRAPLEFIGRGKRPGRGI